MRHAVSLMSLFVLGVSCLPTVSKAREYIGFGQEGDPGSLSLQNYFDFDHTSPSKNTISNFFELSYFSNTLFTGTTRDQLEVWIGSNVGYQTTQGAQGSSGWGISVPEIGTEYYLNVIQPTAPVNSPGYFTFWTSPTFFVNFPNGDTQTAGYGSGADNYSLAFNVDNYMQIGRLDITFNPVELEYSFRNLNKTPVTSNVSTNSTSIPAAFTRGRGGLSVTVADFAIAYQVTPSLAIGVLHQFNFNNIADSNFAPTREGFIGPGFTYAGFAKRGLFFSGTVQTDYYNSGGTTHNTYVAAWVSKEF